MSAIARVIDPRENDLGGGFKVRRLLPFHAHKMVGPFVFFDHFGPATYEPGEGFDVRPHPHIGLATVTYLFEGAIRHRDSLGTDIVIRPGAVNWMTAGKGIVHSERTPQEERASGQTLHGLQTWVALPKSHEAMAPAFKHHPTHTLPVFEIGGAQIRLLAGDAWEHQAPVEFPWNIVNAMIEAPADTSLTLPADLAEERAIYIASGGLGIQGETYSEGQMIIFETGADITLVFEKDTKCALIGGKKMDGKRFIDWNFVASDKALIAAARHDWQLWVDQGYQSDRFGALDEGEHIPLPGEPS